MFRVTRLNFTGNLEALERVVVKRRKQITEREDIQRLQNWWDNLPNGPDETW